MGRLMRPHHRVAKDGYKVNMLNVKDAINEVSGVVCQHTSIGGREYVVHEDAVGDLHNRPTLLVW